MTISQPMPFVSEILEAERIPEEKLAYFRARFRNRFHAFVLSQFKRAEKENTDFSKATLARKLGKKPEQITRWLGAPGNWELDTVSDLLLGMGFEPHLSAASLQYGAIQPSNEQWRKQELEEETKGDATSGVVNLRIWANQQNKLRDPMNDLLKLRAGDHDKLGPEQEATRAVAA
jgi:hypothetical protein